MIEHNIIIEKDPMSKIARNAVNEAELMVLRRIHGEASVQVVRSYELDEKFAKQFDPDQEIERLRARYKTRKGADAPFSVNALFPGGARDVARVVGVRYAGSGDREHVERSVIDLGESRERVAEKRARKAAEPPESAVA